MFRYAATILNFKSYFAIFSLRDNDCY